MTTDLEQIAKQVSLLNRLIELLRMQEEPKPEHLDELVEVAKEIHTSYGQETWRIECYCPGMDANYYLVCIIHNLFQAHAKGWVSANLEAILNKYGRSLTE